MCKSLTFGDGVRKRVDLQEHLTGEVFEPLRDLRLFRTVRVEPDLDTICWDNGADMAPEFLYEIGEALAPVSPALAVAEAPARYGDTHTRQRTRPPRRR